MRFTQQKYISLGRLASVTDPLAATTSYTYDATGNLIAIANALGNAAIYEYDIRGRKTYEGGATYPVRYTYDDYNVMTNMINQSKEFWKPEYHAHGVFASGIENAITHVLHIFLMVCFSLLELMLIIICDRQTKAETCVLGCHVQKTMGL